MTKLSPLRLARDQAIIAACLAEAMEQSGAPLFQLGSEGPDHDEMIRRAASLRKTALRQRALARSMRRRTGEGT
jgi:hypothetical protein